MKSKEFKLVQSWLGKVGWEGKEILDKKLQMIESIMKEMEALAADLPSASPSMTT